MVWSCWNWKQYLKGNVKNDNSYKVKDILLIPISQDDKQQLSHSIILENLTILENSLLWISICKNKIQKEKFHITTKEK